MKYVHCVFFSCKPETADADIEAQIADAQNLLGHIPTVRLVRSGRRDATMQRDVNVKDYDIGLTVLFDDKAGLQTYADHPLHLEYVGKYKQNWAAFRVFDLTA
ncbi:MAG TPA: Dabb family protein [Phycisphaerae bacterium]|nr:Dabb family protein [Phycisphaerae bacterium]